MAPHPPALAAHFGLLELVAPPVAICRARKVASASLTALVVAALEPAARDAWLLGPSMAPAAELVARGSTLRVVVARHPLERLADTYVHLVHTGAGQEHMFPCHTRSSSSCLLTTREV